MPHNLYWFKIASSFRKIYIFIINTLNWYSLFFYAPQIAATYELRYDSLTDEAEETAFV
jgi:hypothetical protein